MRRTKIGAIDVGTTKVCTIMGDIDDKGALRILGVGIAPSHGIQKALVVSVNDAREAIRESIRRAEKTAGYRLESAYVGVTGRHINSVNNRGIISITRSDQLVRPSDLKRVLEVAKSINIPSDHRVLHVIPRDYALDGQAGVKNPVGMHGFRLDVETHIVTAAINSIQNLTKCIRGVGVDIDDLVLEPLASAEAVLTEEERQKGVLLADIGGGTTDVVIIKDDSVYHSSVIPIAGYQVTRDISLGLGLSYELAEEMKKKYGNVMFDEGRGETDVTVTTDGHSVSYNDLSEIIRVRIDELLRLMVLELPRADYAKLVPAGLVLTGGCSNLPGIAELGSAVTRLPVRVGVPVNLYGVSDVLQDPAYATSVGLVLWKMRNQSTKSSLSGTDGISVRSFFSRLFKMFR
ncbi:MAG: cell division protein FtsA [Dehalococcoidales bacterium]|nr:cell division protein FtsA [Dehalococcoidales bacterium]